LENVPLGNFSALRGLSLQGNRIRAINSSTLANLVSLRTLIVSRNLLTSFDFSTIARAAPQLATLDVSANQIREPYPSLGSISAVTINLAGNMFYGLEPLDCDETGGPCFLSPAPLNLQSLDLSDNVVPRFRVMLQTFGSKYGTLMHLYLRNASLTGSIPSLHLARLVNLQVLDLSGNAITGTINDLSVLTALSSLDVRNTLLSWGPQQRWPSFLQPSTNRHRGSGAFTCFEAQGANGVRLRLDIDDSYFDYALCYCESGFYGPAPNCSRCLPNANCAGYGDSSVANISRKAGMMFAQPGYWGTPPRTMAQMRNGSYPVQYLECMNADTSRTPCMHVADSDINCIEGYEDRLCSRCSAGYFSFGWQLCIACPKDAASKGLTAALLAIGGVGVVVWSLLASPSSSGLTKILIFFLQLIGQVKLPVRIGFLAARETTDSISNLKISAVE